jgi:hypothetical protein
MGSLFLPYNPYIFNAVFLYIFPTFAVQIKETGIIRKHQLQI